MKPNVTTPDSEQQVQLPPALLVKKGLNKDFKVSSQNSILGVCMIVLGVLGLFLTNMATFGTFIGVGILMLLFSSHVPLKFREDHFIFKPGIASSAHQVSYNDITRIEYQRRKIVVYRGEKKISVAKNIFSSEDREEVEKIFKSIKQ